MVQLIYLRWSLLWYEVVLGLSIKLEKSELILVCEVPNLEELVFLLGFGVGKLPI